MANRLQTVSTGQIARDRDVSASLGGGGLSAVQGPSTTGQWPTTSRHSPRCRAICSECASSAHRVPSIRAGDAEVEFSIQSVSKPFVFALVCQAIGEEAAREKLGVNSTGLPFNSVIAIERTGDGTTNPMVNAGAIAAASLAPGDSADAKWEFLRDGLSRFAGRELTLNHEVYSRKRPPTSATRASPKCCQSYDRIYFDPLAATDIYTKQCSLNVTVRDLAAMAATLANGGVNPLTGESVIDPIHCQHVLAVMVTAGLYENSGDWLYDTGLPGKSGVSGGMVAVAPGKGGLADVRPATRFRRATASRASWSPNSWPSSWG